MLAEFTKMTKTQSSIGKHPLLTLILSFDVYDVFQSLSFICFRSWMYLWFKAVKIFRQKKSVTREMQEDWPLTFWLKDQYLVSSSCLSFEYEGRSLIIATIQRYCTGKNAPILSHSDLDLQQIDPFLYKSIPVMIIDQYQYVVQPYRLNYGIIWTCLRKVSAYRWQIAEGQQLG